MISSLYSSSALLAVLVPNIIGIPAPVNHPHGPGEGVFGADYAYDRKDSDNGPNKWTGVCLSGSHQSPIDLKYKENGVGWGYTKMFFSPQYLTYQNGFYFANKGHTFQVQLNSNQTDPNSQLIFSGAWISKEKYSFAQLHFHWGDRDEVGSEHTLQGQRYPMEIHFVHFKSKYLSLANALSEKNADTDSVMVFSVLCELGDENIALRPVIDAAKLTSQRDPNKDQRLQLQRSSRSINIYKILPRSLNFIRYMGSLTTPPCTEKVSWTVFSTPIQVSTAQLETLRRLHNREGKEYYNYRPLQKLNGRKLKYYQVPRPGTESATDPSIMVTQSVTKTLNEINALFANFLSVVSNAEYCGDGELYDDNEIEPFGQVGEEQKEFQKFQRFQKLKIEPTKTKTVNNTNTRNRVASVKSRAIK